VKNACATAGTAQLERDVCCKQRRLAAISAQNGAVLADNHAFCETVPFPKSDTIVMLGSGAFKSGTGIPKSARNVMDSDELLVVSFLFCRIILLS
jgi:hypothetical protein